MYLLLWCFIIIKNCGKLSKMGIYKNNFFFFFGVKKLSKSAAKHTTHINTNMPQTTHINAITQILHSYKHIYTYTQF